MTTARESNPSPGWPPPKAAEGRTPPRVSIVIPTVNEGEALDQTLRALSRLHPSPWELIVVDGHSEDETVAAAKLRGAKVLTVPIRRRAYQLHVGAQASQGEVLAFVHADTSIPEDAVAVMTTTLEDPSVALAGFTSVMVDDQGGVQRFTSWHNAVKTYYAPMFYRPWHGLFRGLRLLFGEQVMFCRRADYLRSGGFDPGMEIMEEADLCLKLNRFGRVRQLPERVYSSDRRVARVGVVRANLMFIVIALGWAVGISPRWLRRIFERM